MQSFAWLWAICGVCSRFGKSWIGVRKGEKVLHTMEMARPVVRRGRRKETTSCEFAGRFLVSHFTICIFCTCDVQKNAQANVSRGRWFRHSIYPDDHVSMAALVCTGRHVVEWPEFRAFHD